MASYEGVSSYLVPILSGVVDVMLLLLSVFVASVISALLVRDKRLRLAKVNLNDEYLRAYGREVELHDIFSLENFAREIAKRFKVYSYFVIPSVLMCVLIYSQVQQ